MPGQVQTVEMIRRIDIGIHVYGTVGAEKGFVEKPAEKVADGDAGQHISSTRGPPGEAMTVSPYKAMEASTRS